MSDLSLADIFNIAVLNLPIYPQDLWAADLFSTEGLDGEPDPKLSGKDLLAAAVNGNVEHLQKYIDTGTNVDFSDAVGQAAAHLAADHGRLEIVQVLVKGDADLHAVMGIGFTPLHMACAAGQEAVTRYLIEAGTNVNFKLKTHEAACTPLSVASREGRVECVRVLLDAGRAPRIWGGGRAKGPDPEVSKP